MKLTKKQISLGALAAVAIVAIPVATVVSCGSKDKTSSNNSKTSNKNGVTSNKNGGTNQKVAIKKVRKSTRNKVVTIDAAKGQVNIDKDQIHPNDFKGLADFIGELETQSKAITSSKVVVSIDKKTFNLTKKELTDFFSKKGAFIKEYEMWSNPFDQSGSTFEYDDKNGNKVIPVDKLGGKATSWTIMGSLEAKFKKYMPTSFDGLKKILSVLADRNIARYPGVTPTVAKDFPEVNTFDSSQNGIGYKSNGYKGKNELILDFSQMTQGAIKSLPDFVEAVLLKVRDKSINMKDSTGKTFHPFYAQIPQAILMKKTLMFTVYDSNMNEYHQELGWDKVQAFINNASGMSAATAGFKHSKGASDKTIATELAKYIDTKAASPSIAAFDLRIWGTWTTVKNDSKTSTATNFLNDKLAVTLLLEARKIGAISDAIWTVSK